MPEGFEGHIHNEAGSSKDTKHVGECCLLPVCSSGIPVLHQIASGQETLLLIVYKIAVNLGLRTFLRVRIRITATIAMSMRTIIELFAMLNQWI